MPNRLNAWRLHRMLTGLPIPCLGAMIAGLFVWLVAMGVQITAQGHATWDMAVTVLSGPVIVMGVRALDAVFTPDGPCGRDDADSDTDRP